MLPNRERGNELVENEVRDVRRAVGLCYADFGFIHDMQSFILIINNYSS